MDLWNATIVVITILVVHGYASLVWWRVRRHTKWLNLYLSELLVLLFAAPLFAIHELWDDLRLRFDGSPISRITFDPLIIRSRN